MITLGIDVGTTHTKVLALQVATGETLALEAAPTPMRRGADGEGHPAADVLKTVIELMSKVVHALDAPGDISALSVASVGEEVVLVDDAGKPIGETIAWYDPRGFEEAQTFAAGPGVNLRLSRRWPPDPTFSLFKLLWTREHRPQEFAEASTWTDLGGFVLAGLGGDLVMDWSHASRAGAFDLVERAWDRETIEAAGIDIGYARPVPSGSVIGTVGPAIAGRVGLPSSVAIVTGGHDHLCAAFGAGVRSPSELFLSAGTSEAHLALLRTPLEGEEARGIDQGCFVDASSYYAHINIHSGHFFRQWRRLLYADVGDEAMYSQIAGAPETVDGVAFELTDDLRRGRLDRVPYDADRAVIMRAILQGLANRSAAIVDRLEVAAGSRYDLILVAGHPTRVPVWKAMRMATYGRPMAAVDEPESAAFGAAVMAAVAMDAAGAGELVARRVPWLPAEIDTGERSG